MRVGVGRAGRAVAGAALAAVALTGCAQAAGPGAGESAGASAGAPADGERAAAESGGRVGAAGSACELPVSFDIAERWEPEAIDAAAARAAVEQPAGSEEPAGPEDSDGSDGSGDADGSDGADDPDGLDEELAAELADALLRQGPVTAACEVDAKPAGHIGFLRVFTGERGQPGGNDARTVLENFVLAEESEEVSLDEQRYRTFRSGRLTGVEVSYLRTSAILEETTKQRALAVVTADGPVVLHLGGLDDEEHEAMLPAFDLAKRTLRTS
ncbi:lipoprotein [Streptomyces sp. JB150]|uniref:lipoprotein n=1 Tax=Streptomyces sp. JB150 TaxID=2714844 RepID=UPI001407DB90|nr:lipoprotein [Streptomyces sp. JB150]QIJ60880.1 hypothetical protein G7Z13_01630 [Streptomyces sp. JB150]